MPTLTFHCSLLEKSYTENVKWDRFNWQKTLNGLQFHTKYEFTDLAAAHNIASHHKLKIKLKFAEHIVHHIDLGHIFNIHIPIQWNIQKGDRMKCVFILCSIQQHSAYITFHAKTTICLFNKMHIWYHWLWASNVGIRASKHKKDFTQSQCFRWCVSKFNF